MSKTHINVRLRETDNELKDWYHNLPEGQKSDIIRGILNRNISANKKPKEADTGQEIDIKQALINVLSGHELKVDLDWLIKHDPITLDFIISDKKGIEVTEITDQDREKFMENESYTVLYDFREDRQIIFVANGEEFKLFDDDYLGLDWEYLIIFVIALNLLK